LIILRHTWLTLGVIMVASLVNPSLHRNNRPSGDSRVVAALVLATENCAGEARAATLAGKASNSLKLLPGVIVDAAAGRIYLMNPQDGIDAVEFTSGKLLWTTKAAAKPLAVFDDRLVAQAEATKGSPGLQIVLMDTTHNGRVESTISLPMPAGVMPRIDEGQDTSSTVDAQLEPQGLLVTWSVSSRKMSGIARPGPPPEHKDSGAALISLQGHQVKTLTSDEAAAMLRSGSAKPPRLSGNEGLYFPPQEADGFFVSLKLGPASAGQPVVLKRWKAETGAPLPDVDLGLGYAAWSISADGTFFLIAKTVGVDGTGVMNYLWSIYAIASGARVAEIKLPQAATAFFVADSILAYTSVPRARRVMGSWQKEPLEVRALNIKSGLELWKRAVRETGYRGAYPPLP
jgi:hypothetical protein